MHLSMKQKETHKQSKTNGCLWGFDPIELPDWDRGYEIKAQ